MINYYDLIGVSMGAPEEELREKIVSGINKWRKRVNAPNPEKQREASENLEMLQKAQSILLNPEKRNEYDKELQAASTANQQANAADEQTNVDDVSNRLEELEKRYDFHFDEGDYSNAIVIAREMVNIDSTNAYSWAQLAIAHRNWDEFADARYEINQAISLLPNEAHFYYLAHSIYIHSKDINHNEIKRKSREFIDKALNIEPHNVDYKISSANLYYDDGNYQKAIEILESLREKGELKEFDEETLTLAYMMKIENECATRVNYGDGSHRYFYTDLNLINRAKEIIQSTVSIAKTNQAKTSLNRVNNAVEEALKNEYNFKFLIPLIICAIWFLGALESFSLISMAISGAIIYFSWKKFREPVYVKNHKFIKTLN